MIPFALLALKGKLAWSWAIRHILLILSVALAVLVAYLYLRGNHYKSQARSNALAADSIEAASSHTVERTEARISKVLGDSLRLFERRAIQAEIKRDALDKSLNRISVANAQLILAIDAIRSHASAPVTVDSADVRRSTFTVEENPFTLTAAVALPRPPMQGTIDTRFVMKPISLGVRLQCGEPVRGIKPATIVVTTPPWMNAEVQGAQQSPESCNPIVKQGGHKGISRWWVVPIVAGSIGTWEGFKQIRGALDKK